MDVFFQVLTRIILLLAGALFFVALFFIGLVVLMLWVLRSLWYKVTGRKPPGFGGFRFNPRQGFGYFYSRTSTKADKDSSAPRRSQRPLEDVTDVEVKEVKPPSDSDDPPQSLGR